MRQMLTQGYFRQLMGEVPSEYEQISDHERLFQRYVIVNDFRYNLEKNACRHFCGSAGFLLVSDKSAKEHLYVIECSNIGVTLQPIFWFQIYFERVVRNFFFCIIHQSLQLYGLGRTKFKETETARSISLLLVSGHGLHMKFGNVSLVYNFSQFWSLLDQSYLSPGRHSFLREQVVSQVDEIIAPSCLMYACKLTYEMRFHIFVLLLLYFGVRMFVVSSFSFNYSCYTQIVPQFAEV